MHELGIAESILNRATRESALRGEARITGIGIRVGELSGVDPSALSFAWEALVKDTPLEDVVLEIDFRKRTQRCAACAREFESNMLFSACPDCASEETICISGDELDIAFIDLEDRVCA